MDGVKKPYILVGETRSRANIERLRSLGWGRIFTKQPPSPYPYERWAFDNGAYSAYCHNREFPEQEFLWRLDAASTARTDPYFAVIPDIVAGGLSSLEFSAKWRMSGRLVDEWRWYLAVQDGMTPADVEPHLHLYDGIFLGGTDRFKATAYRWAQLAHKHHLQFHYGRASTPRKLVSAFRSGADSCDSSHPLWSAERFATFAYRWQGLGIQKEMTFDVAICRSQ
jgi:hypothetical protein